MPQWRYQVVGAQVEPILREDFEPPDRHLVSHRVTHFEHGVMVEAETRFSEHGETRLWRDSTSSGPTASASSSTPPTAPACGTPRRSPGRRSRHRWCGRELSILDSAVGREPLGEHDGRSGASLERVVLADGRRLVVKRSRWATDLVRRLTDDRVRPREAALWQAGVLDRAGARHAIVDAWTRAPRPSW